MFWFDLIKMKLLIIINMFYSFSTHVHCWCFNSATDCNLTIQTCLCFVSNFASTIYMRYAECIISEADVENWREKKWRKK